MLHLNKVGAKLTKLSKDQDYIGVNTKGPFKSDSYRYPKSSQMLKYSLSQ